ncbi:CBS domain-containing protein [Streptomyces niveus]
MDHRGIGELMTRDVVSVRLDTPFKEIAGALADHGVSPVPVLDDGDRPVGVVSEADVGQGQVSLHGAVDDEHTVAVPLRLCGSVDGETGLSETAGRRRAS